jgi:hypothetical protein
VTHLEAVSPSPRWRAAIASPPRRTGKC